MSNKEHYGRIGYIDFLRGFGIICMVMGHIGFGTLFDKLIHCFHMPMFFIISGFLHYLIIKLIHMERIKTVLTFLNLKWFDDFEI